MPKYVKVKHRKVIKMNRIYKTGLIFKGNNGDFKVLEETGLGGKKKCKIKFIKSGYETTVNTKYVQNGSLVQDRLSPSICGVGITGDIPKDTLGNKLYGVWRRMIKRCYGKNYAPSHKSQQIAVCDDWIYLSNFIADVKKIDGWNEEDFLSKKIVLDKDKKTILSNEKEYSVKTTSWISPEENSRYRKNSFVFLVTKPNDETYIETSIRKCSKDTKLSIELIRKRIMDGEQDKSGFKFKLIK